MHDFMPELTCVGCGPGDPELLTVKAVNAIKNADVIMCPTSKEGKPSIALSVVSSLIDKDKNPEIVNLVFPMTKDKDILENTWQKNSQIIAESVFSGKKVVYITVIPGIVSMFTFASKIGISLAEGAEKMAVIPSCYDLSKVKEIAKNCDTMVFLKDGRYFDQVINLLREAGFSKDSIFAIGQDLDTDKEIVKKLTLGQVTEDTITSKYFSIMVVKRV